MVQPITWRNVNSPTFGGAAQIMDQAGRSLSGAFDTLRQTKDTYEEGRTDRNTQDFLSQMNQYRTPEALAEAQQNGDIASLREKLSGNGLIDTNQTSGDAIRTRLAGMRENEMAKLGYDEKKRALAEREDVNRFQSMLAGNQFDEAGKFLGESELANRGELAQQLKQASQDSVDRKHTLNLRDQQQTQFDQTQNTYQEQEDAETAWGALRTGINQRDQAYQDRTQKALSVARENNVPMKSNGQIDFAKATPVQLKMLEPHLNSKPVSDTQFRDKQLASIREMYPELPAQQEQQMIQYLDQQLTRNIQLAPTDQAKIESRQKKLDDSMGITSNPYYRPDRPADMTAAGLLEKVPNIDKMDEDERRDLVKEIAQFSNSEIEVDNKLFKITPEILEMALQGYEVDDIGGWDLDLEENIEAILGNTRMAKEYENYQQWKKDREALATSGKQEFGRGPGLREMTQQFQNTLAKFRQ